MNVDQRGCRQDSHVGSTKQSLNIVGRQRGAEQYEEDSKDRCGEEEGERNRKKRWL